MGCDIHLHTEVKIDGVWHHYSAPNVDRNYSLFWKMAGVRGRGTDDFEPIARPRCLPADVTAITRIDASRMDGHSHSWLSAAEIQQLEDWVESRGWDRDHCWFTKNWGRLFGGSYSGFTKYPNDRCVDDVRFVFWFDC
jgi:hypothetical protein